MRRRAAFVILALTAWTLGSALGAIAPGSSEASGDPPIMLSAAHAGYTPDLTGDRPISILAIGSGARPYQGPERGLADSIHLIEIDPRNRHAVIIGIPRDSWVSIPGYGMNKINASMAIGGPPLLVRTVEQMSGIHIQYFALTSFWGLTSMIDQIGGLTIRVPFPMHDSFSRADFHPGVQRLRGAEVLAFSRDRHSLRSGDFGRSEDGGRVLIAALTQFRNGVREGPDRAAPVGLGGDAQPLDGPAAHERPAARVPLHPDPAEQRPERRTARRRRLRERHVDRSALPFGQGDLPRREPFGDRPREPPPSIADRGAVGARAARNMDMSDR